MGNTERTDPNNEQGESLAERLISRRSIRGRYLSWRTVKPPPRSITNNNTAPKKVLQITTFMAVRVMRAVSCELNENIAIIFRDLLTNQGPFKAALNAFVAEETALEDLGT